MHEELPGNPYRIPVRFIVPKDQKAKGFHLTGGHQLRQFDGDAKISREDQVLLEGGVGRVHTMIQILNQSDQTELGKALDTKFIETLDPKYSIQYYGWPLTLMKAITAAYSEGEHLSLQSQDWILPTARGHLCFILLRLSSYPQLTIL